VTLTLLRRLVTGFRSVVASARRSPRSRWWTTFGLASILCLSWTFATPLFAAPDEPAHVVRAVSLARGTILGHTVRHSTPAERGSFRPIDLQGAYQVQLPEIYRSAYSAGCFAFKADTTANCASFRGSGRSVPVLTTAGGLPPAYYAVVGLMARPLPDGPAAIYWMRVVGALIAAALLASAVASIERTAHPGLAGAGIAVAVTPMVLFLSGVVNPSGVEIPAAVTVWATGVVLAREAPVRVDRRLVVRLAVSAGVLALARPLGPLWLLPIGATLLAVVARGGWLHLWRSAALRLGAAAVAACAVAQVVWDAAAGTFNTATTNTVGVHIPVIDATRSAIGLALTRFDQMIGVFGWLDTNSPALTTFLWIAVIGTLLTVAALVGDGRLVAAALVTAVLTVLVPVALEVPNVHAAGFFWQGRYGLPLAVGVPILAGIAAATSRLPASLRTGRFLALLGAALVVAQVLAFFQALRRYAVGAHGSLLLFWLHYSWAPPLTAPVVMLAFTLAYVGFVAWLFTLQPVGPRGEVSPASTGVADRVGASAV
jgi:hypothetical protein